MLKSAPRPRAYSDERASEQRGLALFFCQLVPPPKPPLVKERVQQHHEERAHVTRCIEQHDAVPCEEQRTAADLVAYAR